MAIDLLVIVPESLGVTNQLHLSDYPPKKRLARD